MFEEFFKDEFFNSKWVSQIRKAAALKSTPLNELLFLHLFF